MWPIFNLSKSWWTYNYKYLQKSIT
jgi:hypothetical protein